MTNMAKYRSDPEFRAKVLAWESARRARKMADPDWRAHKNAMNRECQARRAANPKIRAHDRANMLARHRDRLANDPEYKERHRSHQLRGVAKRRGALGKFESISRAKVYARDKGVCHLCGQLAPAKSWHLDHIIPLAAGGPHSMDNVAVSHATCNIRKGAKLLTPVMAHA